MTKLYVVVPCYNEEEALPITTGVMSDKFDRLIEEGKITQDSRIVLVDDGSKDKTWEIISNLHNENRYVLGIKLSRNRGHQNALICGLMSVIDMADAVISIDADLQDDIDAFDKMLEKYEEGCDIVYGVREKRKTDTFFKRFTAEGYYKLLNKMGAKIVFNHADYRLLSNRALRGLAEFKEVNLFIRGMIPMIGYKSDVATYARTERVAGESKYPLRKMLALAFEGITSLSVKPIKMITRTGMTFSVFSTGFLIYFFIRFLLNYSVSGFAVTMAFIGFIAGVQLIAAGIIGSYIGKIYIETKQRPRYIVEKFLKK